MNDLSPEDQEKMASNLRTSLALLTFITLCMKPKDLDTMPLVKEKFEQLHSQLSVVLGKSEPKSSWLSRCKIKLKLWYLRTFFTTTVTQ